MPPPPRRLSWPVVLFATAVLLRLAAARGDLVLDEVWTRLIVLQIDAAAKIFVTATDNNHILNTLVIYALGPSAPPYAYRLPAAFAGSLAVWFGYLLARRAGPAAGICVLVLLGFSYPVIVFCTEARGYAYLACCTLAAWWGLEEYLDRPRAGPLAVFAVAASLGFLAHLTFAFAYAGLGLYSVVRLLPHRRGWERCLYLHALPVITCVLLYVAIVEKIWIGGGTQHALRSTLLATFSLLAGGPERGSMAVVAAIVSVLAVALSLVAVCRRSLASWVLYLGTMFAAPAIVLCFSWNDVVYPRYFLVPMLFAYVSVGIALGRLADSRKVGRWGPHVLLGIFVACNLVPVVRLIGMGRVKYSQAVRWMGDNTAGTWILVAGDHDFRNRTLAEYYAQREHASFADRGKELIFIDRELFLQQGFPGTEWFLLHSFGGDPPHPETFTTPNGFRYKLDRVFPHEGISGFTWWLYRRQ